MDAIEAFEIIFKRHACLDQGFLRKEHFQHFNPIQFLGCVYDLHEHWRKEAEQEKERQPKFLRRWYAFTRSQPVLTPPSSYRFHCIAEKMPFQQQQYLIRSLKTFREVTCYFFQEHCLKEISYEQYILLLQIHFQEGDNGLSHCKGYD